jgi:Bacterial Ig-like domain
VNATRILAFCLSWTAGACYQTPQPDCGFVCGPAGECPDGYQCASDRRCHREGTPASLMCATPDAAPRDVAVFDVPMFDAPVFDAPGDGTVLPDGDVTPPTLMSSTPANGATSVPRTTTITMVFDEAVLNVQGTTVAVTIGANPVNGTLATLSTTTYEFTPQNMLMNNATITVSLTAGITDVAGNALVPVSFSFSTGN